jgi:hypothetical protein
MANLKIDLLNNLRNDKYFKEIELVRLAGDANMNYEIKINEIVHILSGISRIDDAIKLADKYFLEQQPQQNISNNVQQPISTHIHNGQTHGE